jgi:hypothetical protein
MAAAVYPITLEQGADFNLSITWNDPDGDPVDLTGYTAAAQVRESFDSADALLDFTITGMGVDGVIELSATAAETEAAGGGVWDLEVTNGAEVTRLLQGPARFSREVTQ